jgi:hypothetical protein
VKLNVDGSIFEQTAENRALRAFIIGCVLGGCVGLVLGGLAAMDVKEGVIKDVSSS